MISDVLTYARARLSALGYTEWEDAFNFENLPKGRIDRAFHVQLGAPTGGNVGQDNQEIEVPFTVRVFVSPAKNTKSNYSTAVSKTDTIIADLLKSTNRLGQAGLKNISFNTATLEPIADSNDNGVIVELTFTALVVISTR